MSKPGPAPKLSTLTCQTCPARLSQHQVDHGLRRCTTCRAGTVRTALPPKRVDGLKAPTSWWIDAPRNITAIAETHVPRMRQGVQPYNERVADEGGKRLLKKMRSAL